MPLDNNDIRNIKPGKLLREMQTGEPVDDPVEITLSPERIKQIKAPFNTRNVSDQFIQDNTQEAYEAGFGLSRYDSSFTPGEDLEQQRAVEQSGLSKIVNGALKGGVTAATTAVNTVAGTLWGAAAGTAALVRNLAEGEDQPLRSAIDEGVNNFVSTEMMNIQKLSEKWFPNYRTQTERSDEYQKQWIKHVFTPNFIGDSFLKNFGFTVGAIAGGSIWAKALGAVGTSLLAGDLMKGVTAAAAGNAEATAALEEAVGAFRAGKATRVQLDLLKKNIKSAAQKLNALSASQMLVGATIGAMGEGVTEGIMARNEFMEGYDAKWRNNFSREYAKQEEDVLNSKNINWVINQEYIMPDGTKQNVPELTKDGKDEVVRRQKDVVDKYQEDYEFAKVQGDRLASTTFALNIPVLTLSNTLQFGRVLSGGWKTARNTERAVRGGIGANSLGKVVSDVAGKGNVAALTAFNAAKVGTTEASEEMIQGFISSGAKNVADARLTAFHDDGYDRGVARDYASWVNTMMEGGGEYLGDWKNWQEGFMGMITGLVGIPGKGYFSGERGGIFQAYNEAKEKVDKSNDLANRLNARVNSKEFQNLWQGYSRHNLYEKQMQAAVAKNDQYSWKTANDKQAISDIMLFADAGRLNDLYDLIDRYSAMSDAEAVHAGIIDAVKTDATSQDIDNNPTKTLETVKKHATEFKALIQDYREVYDAMKTIAPINTSDEHLREMIFTAMQIKRFEDRYFSVLEETLRDIEPLIEKNISETNDIQKKQILDDQISKFAQTFSKITIPTEVDPTSSKQTADAMDWLKKKAKSIKGLTQKIKDLEALSEDRRKFYEKFSDLSKISSEEFAEQATSQEKETKEVRKQVVRQAVKEYDSVSRIRESIRAINSEEDRQKYIADLAKIRDENKNVADYFDIIELQDDYRKVYNSLDGRPEPDSPVDKAANIMAETLFDSVDNTEEVFRHPKIYFPTRDSMIDKMRAILGSSFDDTRIGQIVDAASYEVERAIADLAEKRQYHTNPAVEEAFGGAVPNREERTSAGGAFADVTPSPRGRVAAPSPFDNIVPQRPQNVPAGVYIDSRDRQWKKGDEVILYRNDTDGFIDPSSGVNYTITSFRKTANGTVEAYLTRKDDDKAPKVIVNLSDDEIISRIYPASQPLPQRQPVQVEAPEPAGVNQVTENERASEMMMSLVGAELPAISAEVIDEKNEATGVKDIDYYHQSVPEISSFILRKAFDILNDTRLSISEKRKRLSQLDLRDFAITDPDYADTWNALASWRGQNAFENIATRVHANDKVKFVIDPSFPLDQNGNPQVLVLLDQGGQGKDLILTVLHNEAKDKSVATSGATYKNIKSLHETIREQYSTWTAKEDGELFVFSDENGNAHTSRVFMTRNGFIAYGKEERPIFESIENGENTTIPGYDANAPIMFIGREGRITQLKGSDNVDRSSLEKTVANLTSLAGASNPTGNLYYLAKDGRGKYSIPIRLNVEHYTKDTMEYSSPTFEAINSAIKDLADMLASGANATTQADLESLQAQVIESRKDLGRLLDMHDLRFGLRRDNDTGRPLLLIGLNSNKEAKPKKVYLDNISEKWLKDALAGYKLSVQIDADINIDRLINDGILTSNAEALRPKGADFYYNSWDGSQFVGTPKQQEVLKKELNLTEDPEDIKNEPEVKEPATQVTFDAPEDVESPKKEEPVVANPNEKEQTVATIAWEKSYRTWDGLTDELRSNLEAQGWTQEDWNDPELSDDDKKQALGCA